MEKEKTKLSLKNKIELIVFYMLIPSIIFFVFIERYFAYSLILSCIGTLAILSIINKRMCRLLQCNRFTHNITQSLSIKSHIKLGLRNNFNENGLNENVYRELAYSQKELRKFFEEHKGKKFKTTTNEFMYERLLRFEKKGIITIEKTNKEEKVVIQIAPKLFLVGLYTATINIFNKEFWKYIMEEVKINNYVIKVNE